MFSPVLDHVDLVTSISPMTFVLAGELWVVPELAPAGAPCGFFAPASLPTRLQPAIRARYWRSMCDCPGMRRRVKEGLASPDEGGDKMEQLLCRLVDPPEERQRPLHDAGHIPAPGLIGEEEAGRSVDHVLACGLVEPTDRGFLFVEVAGLVPGIDLGLDLGDIRPAEPRLVAVSANRRVA